MLVSDRVPPERLRARPAGEAFAVLCWR